MFLDGQWDDFIEYHLRERDERPRQWFRYVRQMYRWKITYWVFSLLGGMGDSTMARGKAAPKAAPTTGFKAWTEFVDMPLSEGDMLEIDGYCTESDELFDGFMAVLESGHRVSFSYNPSNDAVICAVTGKEDDCVNKGMTMTSFAGDWVTALRVALYKHAVLAGGKWDAGKAKTARPRMG